MIPQLLSLSLMVWIPRAAAPNPDVNATLARFERECLGKGGAPCEALQAQLEEALYQELMVMYLGGKDPDHRMLRVAARAQLPDLAAFGLRRLGRWQAPEDAPIAAAGLDSPYPAVRSAAAELTRSLGNPQLQRLANRCRGSEGSGTGLVPNEVPDSKTLGTIPYPGSSYSFATSRQDLAIYRTSDAPDKVIAHYAKGKRVLSGAELAELRKQKGGKQNQDAMAQAMMQAVMNGQDPQAAMQQMMASAQAQGVDWTSGIEGVEGVVAPRYVVLGEAGPQKVPSRVVAVYRDEALGATAIAYRLIPPMPDLADPRKTGKRLDPAYLQALQELQMRRD
jgi:hypothetical protein